MSKSEAAQPDNSSSPLFPESKPWRGLMGAIVAGILGTAVGGVLVYHYTTSKLALEYDLIVSEPFRGEKKEVAIAAIKVYNSGDKVVEDLTCRVKTNGAKVLEYKVSGMSDTEYLKKMAGDDILVEVDFFNVPDTLTIQALLEATPEKLTLPSVLVRGKGATGTSRKMSKTSFIGLEPVLAASVFSSVLIVVVLLISTIVRIFFTTPTRTPTAEKDRG